MVDVAHLCGAFGLVGEGHQPLLGSGVVGRVLLSCCLLEGQTVLRTGRESSVGLREGRVEAFVAIKGYQVSAGRAVGHGRVGGYAAGILGPQAVVSVKGGTAGVGEQNRVRRATITAIVAGVAGRGPVGDI